MTIETRMECFAVRNGSVSVTIHNPQSVVVPYPQMTVLTGQSKIDYVTNAQEPK